jgi:alginate O-acetyltransferase complex protein AlgI
MGCFSLSIIFGIAGSETPTAAAAFGRIISVALTFLAVNVAWVFFRAPDIATGRDILAGMFGVFGVALPDALSARFPALRQALEAAGVQFYLGGGRQFAMTCLWLLLAGAIAFFAPNTQEIMRRFRPALTLEATRQVGRRFTFHLTQRWAIGLGLLAAASLLSLSSPTEFLYFQF